MGGIILNNTMFRVSSSPHIRSKESTQRIMLDVIIALMPALFASVYFFGAKVLIIVLTSIVFAVATEVAMQKIMNRPVTINDLSAVVTGLLLAYNVPSTAPWWMVAIGSIFAIAIVKHCFGGLGYNFMNPALAARALLLASWPVRMSSAAFVSPGVNAVTAATPLALFRAGAACDGGLITIRNEMADLEELGYIEQPYTSAGRIPSDKGYRLYVDSIMNQSLINAKKIEYIKQEFVEALGEIDDLVKHASKLLSNITRYTSIAMAPQFLKTSLKHIQLIGIDSINVLVVIVTDAGIVKNSVIRMEENIDTYTLGKISNILNEKLTGLSLDELNNLDISALSSEINGYNEVLNKVLPELFQALKYSDKIEVYHDGAANLLDLPEYSDVQKARDFLNVLEEHDILFKVLDESSKDLSVTIGKENKVTQLKNCSLITATYSLNGKTIGSIGVVGPTRMEYTKVISVVDCLTQNLNDILSKLLKT
jgi:heat-inducible transcriptional repressor